MLSIVISFSPEDLKMTVLKVKLSLNIKSVRASGLTAQASGKALELENENYGNIE